MLGAPHSTIEIKVHESTIFLHPLRQSEHIPENDPILRGVVVLTLLKPKRIRSVVVRLVGFYELSAAGFGRESGQTMETEVCIVSLNEEERLVDKGVHAFAFTLVVPASTAPFESCQYGRVFHKLFATAKGSGIMCADMVTEKEVWLIVNPAAEGEIQDYSWWIESFHEDIGPYAIATASQNLTVGGLFQYNLLLASPPSAIEIHSISAHLLATYSLTSFKHPKRRVEKARQRRNLFFLDSRYPPQTAHGLLQSLSPTSESVSSAPASLSDACVVPPTPPRPLPTKSRSTGPTSHTSIMPLPTRCASESAASGLQKIISPLLGGSLPPLCTVKAGVSYQTSHLARIPNDKFIRPSTLPGTSTPVRVAHDLVLEVKFRSLTRDQEESIPDPPPGIRVLRMARPIVISSCCCTIENLLVPSYSATDDKPGEPGPVSSFDVCQCTAATDKLILQQFAADSLQEKFETAGVKSEY